MHIFFFFRYYEKRLNILFWKLYFYTLPILKLKRKQDRDWQTKSKYLYWTHFFDFSELSHCMLTSKFIFCPSDPLMLLWMSNPSMYDVRIFSNWPLVINRFNFLRSSPLSKNQWNWMKLFSLHLMCELVSVIPSFASAVPMCFVKYSLFSISDS